MQEADIIVVGGGSGGSAAAGRLAEDPTLTIALLEAGGLNTGPRTRVPGFMPFQTERTNWRYETVPQPGLNGRRGYQPRGRGLGGSSAINAMVYIRGHPYDYDHWAQLGCPGWSWDEVLPAFRRSEHNVRGADAFHGADGPLWVSDQRHVNEGSRAFIEAAASLQIHRNDDFNGPRQDGVGLYQVTQRNGERWTAARAYVEPKLDQANLNVVTDAHAEQIVFENSRAAGVTYSSGGERRTIRARRGVVLAGGVFATPQLLMLSGIGPAAHLREHGIDVQLDRAGVGANLQDHIDFVAAFETAGGPFLGQSLRGTLGMAGHVLRWFTHRQGAMTSPFAEAGGFLHTAPDLPAPDVQLHFLPAIVDDHGRAKVKGHGYSCHVCVLRPESAGSVRLSSPDPRAVPLIDPAFLTDDRDVETLKRGARLMYRILEAPELTRYGGRDRYPVDLADDTALEALIRSRADTVYHPVGTARMGSDADAVCDPKLRVRGLDGLWVADASIMPRLVSGNTNAPSIMIGDRCAEFVRAELAA